MRCTCGGRQWSLDRDAVNCVACVAYDNLETARKPMKMDLRSISKLTYATQQTQRMLLMRQIKNPQRTHTKNAMHAEHRIDCVRCVSFCVHALCISVFDCITSRAWHPLRCVAPVALRVLRTTTWKPYVGLRKRTSRSVSKLPYATQRTQCMLVMRRR